MSLRLLCVIAHPDDECFAFGGALALAADRGVETSVLCLTDGQAATNRGTASSAKDLGKLRREEFEAACKVLGVTHTEVLDYQDAKLEFENFSVLAEVLVTRIRTFKPHVILTFGGEGAPNAHPDHTTVSAATTAAFHWAGQPKRYLESGPIHQAQRLYYQTSNFFLPDRYRPLFSPWTHTLDIRSVFDKKIEAFAKHTSQAPLLESTRGLFKEHGQNEYYTLAAAILPQPAAPATDLFAGVAET